jgi:hypothetical protein
MVFHVQKIAEAVKDSLEVGEKLAATDRKEEKILAAVKGPVKRYECATY